MKIALVYDRVTKWGGAERVLLALHELFPEAPLYTAVYDAKSAAWAKVFTVRPSFLTHSFFVRRMHELFPWLMPFAFETFSFEDYDIVISVTSAEAKNIVTNTKTIHLCYCLTPTRYLWSAKSEYEKEAGLGMVSGLAQFVLKRISSVLRRWDTVAASRPDYYIAISDAVKKRIETYYHRPVKRVIYPPVDTTLFSRHFSSERVPKVPYFLAVGRFVGYKKLDLIIDAFNELEWPLVVVGEGRDKRRLMRKAKKDTIHFMQDVDEKDLVALYQHCEAFVHAGEEDFGITAVEAQAAGKPVIAYGKGGMAEIVIDGKTGILFHTQSKAALVAALQQFKEGWYDSSLCKKNAKRFSKEVFAQNMKDTVEALYNKKIV